MVIKRNMRPTLKEAEACISVRNAKLTSRYAVVPAIFAALLIAVVRNPLAIAAQKQGPQTDHTAVTARPIDARTHRALVGAALGYFLHHTSHVPQHEAVVTTANTSFKKTTYGELLRSLQMRFSLWKNGPTPEAVATHLAQADTALTKVFQALNEHLGASQKAALAPHLSALASTKDATTQERVRILINRHGVRGDFGRAALMAISDGTDKKNAALATEFLLKYKAQLDNHATALSIIAKRIETLDGESSFAARSELKRHQKTVERALLAREITLAGIDKIPMEVAQTLGRFATKKTRRKVLQRLQSWHFGLTDAGDLQEVAPLLQMTLSFPFTRKVRQTLEHLLSVHTTPKLGVKLADLRPWQGALLGWGGGGIALATVLAAIKGGLHPGAFAACSIPVFLLDLVARSEVMDYFPLLHAASNWEGPLLALANSKLGARIFRPSDSTMRAHVQHALVEQLGHLAAHSPQEHRFMLESVKPAIERVVREREAAGLSLPETLHALLPIEPIQENEASTQHMRQPAALAVNKLVSIGTSIRTSPNIAKNSAVRGNVSEVAQKAIDLLDTGAMAHASPHVLSKLTAAIEQLGEVCETSEELRLKLQQGRITPSNDNEISSALDTVLLTQLTTVAGYLNEIDSKHADAALLKIQTIRTRQEHDNTP